MTEPLGHDLDVRTSRQQVRGVSVTKVVEPDAWERRATNEPLEHLADDVGMQQSRGPGMFGCVPLHVLSMCRVRSFHKGLAEGGTDETEQAKEAPTETAETN